MAPPKLTPGQPISFPAAEWNRHVEASDAYHRTRSLEEPGSPISQRRESNVVNTKNSSGADRRKGEILEFTGSPLTDFSDGLIWLIGDEPQLTNGFGVLLAAAPDGKFEECQVSGVCTALVNVTDVDHKFAQVSASTYVLQSAASGPVRILYKDSGTGEKECAVLLDAPFVEIHRGIVDNSGSPITKGGSGNVKRYTDGTSSDSGIVDTVTCDWNAVADGKKIIYVKLGSTFYLLNSEKTSQTTLTNMRQKADDTYVEAEDLDIYVDSIDTAAWEDKIELDTYP